MEDPRKPSSGKGEVPLDIASGESETPTRPTQLRSLEQFMAGRAEKDDAWELSAYKAYFNLLAKIFQASSTKSEAIRAHMVAAKKLIEQYHVCEALNTSLNAAYQGLLGPRPGDDLRKIIPGFMVDDHQWKHYQNGDKQWGLFDRKWEDIHKIIVYGAKLILAVRAIQIDQGVLIQNQVMDGFVQFDQNVGTPGNFDKSKVSLIKIQIARTSTEASGHGYPVPGSDSSFPLVRGTLATALLEVLSVDNNEMRVKK